MWQYVHAYAILYGCALRQRHQGSAIAAPAVVPAVALMLMHYGCASSYASRCASGCAIGSSGGYASAIAAAFALRQRDIGRGG
jgi:hypothetical protein